MVILFARRLVGEFFGGTGELAVYCHSQKDSALQWAGMWSICFYLFLHWCMWRVGNQVSRKISCVPGCKIQSIKLVHLAVLWKVVIGHRFLLVWKRGGEGGREKIFRTRFSTSHTPMCLLNEPDREGESKWFWTQIHLLTGWVPYHQARPAHRRQVERLLVTFTAAADLFRIPLLWWEFQF